MADQIRLNGRTVPASDIAQDASGSNYILVRTTGQPLNKSHKNELRELGVIVKEFVGNSTTQIYLCSYPPSSLDTIRNLDYIDYANVYAPKFAVPDVVKNAARSAGSHADDDSDGKVEVDILLHQDIGPPSDAILQRICHAAGVNESDLFPRPGAIRVRLDEGALNRVAAIDEVRVMHTVKPAVLFNDVARGILRLDNGRPSGSVKYRGKGQVVCVADTGFDTGSETDTHEDFTGRVTKLYSWGRRSQGLSDDLDGHGTHVAGSVLGSGEHESGVVIEGTAPEARLVLQSTFSGFSPTHGAMLGGIPSDLGDLFQQAYKDEARIHTNSWGVPLPANQVQWPYDTRCEDIDRFVWEHQDMTILFAAGNSGIDSDVDRRADGKVNLRSIGATASAKNNITVGATENDRSTLESGVLSPYTYGRFWPSDFPLNPIGNDHMANNPEGLAAFSSRGPTAERRLKPDVVAPGTAVLSTLSRKKQFMESVNVFGVSDDPKYWYLAGTSMATPLVAGCCAVIRQALRDGGWKDQVDGVTQPTGSLVKALLINGATPIRGQYMPKEVGEEPNNHSGFGRVDMSKSIPDFTTKHAGYGSGTISEDKETPVTIRIPIPQPKTQTADAGGGSGWTLKITMVYADMPGAALNNDLNLAVVAGKRERHGNIVGREFPVDTAKPFDHENNVEQVVWPDISGEFVEFVVKPFRLMADVAFAYAWRFD